MAPGTKATLSGIRPIVDPNQAAGRPIGHSPNMLNRQNEARAQNVDEQDAENSATALARKIRFLSRPDSYELKKPVRFSFNKEYQISATSMWVWSSRQAYHVSS